MKLHVLITLMRGSTILPFGHAGAEHWNELFDALADMRTPYRHELTNVCESKVASDVRLVAVVIKHSNVQNFTASHKNYSEHTGRRTARARGVVNVYQKLF